MQPNPCRSTSHAGEGASPRRDRFFSAVRAGVEARGAAVVAVCNVTPDSFSDGGVYFDRDSARARVDTAIEEGCDILELGGESTRPSAKPVPGEEQLRRVLPLVTYATPRIPVSVDSTDPSVLEACLRAGAVAVNDVSCGQSREVARVVARFEAAYVLMHARGTLEHATGFGAYPEAGYQDVVAEVLTEWKRAEALSITEGVPVGSFVLDPGFGFSKSGTHSLRILSSLRTITALGVPVMVGASRKSFLSFVDPEALPRERLGASIAAALYGVSSGATLVRVHDVRATRQALALWHALRVPQPTVGDGT